MRTELPMLPRLQPLIDSMLEACCLVDATTLNLLAVNEAAAGLWGLSDREMLTRRITDLAATPEDQLFWQQAIGGLAATTPAGCVALHSDTFILHADGTVREVERRITALPLGDQRPGWMVSLVSLEAQRRAEAELHRIGIELGTALASSHDGILMTDLDGQVRSCNQAMLALLEGTDPRLGEPLAEHSAGTDTSPNRRAARLPERLAAAMADPEDYRRTLSQRQAELRARSGAEAARASRSPRFATDRLHLADGRTLERRLVPQYGRGGAVGWVQIWRDLSEQIATEAQLRLAAQVFESSLDGLLVTDAEGRVVAANPAAARLMGLGDAPVGTAPPARSGADTLLGRYLHDCLASDAADAAVLPPAAERRRSADGGWHGPLSLRHPEGATPVQVSIVALRSATGGGGTEGDLLVLRDQRERLAQQRLLQDLALTDGLTGLGNRARLEHWIEPHLRCEVHPSPPPVALLMVGIDRFHAIHDTLGPDGGDQVLIGLAQRLQGALRTGDLVVRLGGDSFAAVLAGADAPTAEAAARRLLGCAETPLLVAGQPVELSLRAGVAVYPADGADTDSLLRNAGRAMLRVQAHRVGEQRYCLYQPQMSEEMRARLQLDRAMREALRTGGFHLRYQPQVDISTGEVRGAEALCRWHDPVLGEVSPLRFITAAEANGLIGELGRWVLDTAVQQAATWRAAGRDVPVSVNVSILQFQQVDFVEQVRQSLARHGLPGDRLELELTESILIGDLDDVLQQLHQLAESGVRLAIDDFGTGYSSLSYLSRLPVQRLKVDRSFIQRLPDDASDAAVTQAIVEMGRKLGLTVVAEGVETQAQRRTLLAMGCQEIQGYLCAPPLPAADFEVWLASHPTLTDGPRAVA